MLLQEKFHLPSQEELHERMYEVEFHDWIAEMSIRNDEQRRALKKRGK